MDVVWEWIEGDVRDLLKEYENDVTFTDVEEYRKQGAITALKRLLEMWYEE
jgi:hypothetical protein